MTDKVVVIAGGPISLDVVQLQVAGGPASLDVAGGPVQQTAIPEIHVEVVTPPPDNSMLIATGIVVPVALAIFGWWLAHRRKAAVEK